MALVLTPPSQQQEPHEREPQRQHRQAQLEEEQEEGARQGPVSVPVLPGSAATKDGHLLNAAARSLSDAVVVADAAAVSVQVLGVAGQQGDAQRVGDHHGADGPGEQQQQQQHITRPAAEQQAEAHVSQQRRPSLDDPGNAPPGTADASPVPASTAGPTAAQPNAAALRTLQQQHTAARQQRVQAYVASLQQQHQQQQQRRSIAPCQPIHEESTSQVLSPTGAASVAAAAQQQQRLDPEHDVPVWAAKLRREDGGAARAHGSSSNYQEWCQREYMEAHGDFQQSGGWARACGCMPM